jgi:hypothetical protein
MNNLAYALWCFDVSAAGFMAGFYMQAWLRDGKKR